MSSSNFLIPIVLEHTSNAYVYGEEGPELLFNYEFNNVNGVLTLEQMRNTFKYKDNGDNNGILLKYDINNGITMDEWHNLITNNDLSLVTNGKYRNTVTGPVESKFSQHVIQWISSTLFGHPQAQAPLTNENDIINDISNGNSASGSGKLGQQIYNSLNQDISGVNGGLGSNNIIVQSIYEQMVNLGRFNEGSGEGSGGQVGNAIPDTDGFISFPFKQGDKLSFLIKVNCNILNDDPNVAGLPSTEDTGWNGSKSSVLINLFNGINGVVVNDNSVNLSPEVWKFSFVI